MSGSPFALLWSKILDSSVWALDDPYRLVWITLLALKDSEGVVKASVPGLANRARVPLKKCEEALEKFLAPDPYSQSPDEEGRRLKVVSGGWQLINHEEYRFSSEAKRAFWRELKAKERAKKQGATKLKTGGGLPGEAAYVKAETVEQQDAIVTGALPAAAHIKVVENWGNQPLPEEEPPGMTVAEPAKAGQSDAELLAQIAARNKGVSGVGPVTVKKPVAAPVPGVRSAHLFTP